MDLLGSTFAMCFFSETLQKVGSGSFVGDVMFLPLSLIHQYILKFNMEPENDGFQKESPFPGADFQVPGKLEGCIYCISLVSPSISSDFVCRSHLSCPLSQRSHPGSVLLVTGCERKQS